MEKFTVLCVFVAGWLLFIFPLYQGKMELMESNTVFAKYQGSKGKKKSISFVYWLFPPLLLHYYKKNTHQQLVRLASNKKDLQNFYSFYNKGFAWYFVSYAGFLHAIVSSYEVMEKLELGEFSTLATLIVVVIFFFAGNHYVDYLCSKKRHQRFIKGIATTFISDEISKKTNK